MPESGEDEIFSAIDLERLPIHWIIGVDFGTTYSAVAFRNSLGSEVIVLSDYLDDPETNYPRFHVPSEVCYRVEEGPPVVLRRRIVDCGKVVKPESVKRTTKGRPKLPPNGRTQKPICGWGVHDALGQEHDEIHKWRAGRVLTPKLILEPHCNTTEKALLDNTISRLIKLGIIKCAEDVIEDYLIYLLDDVHRILSMDHHLSPIHTFEFAFSYPLTWNAKSCRLFEQIIATALESSAFNHTTGNFFLVHEPEAAGIRLVARRTGTIIRDNEIFGVLDCGGGSCDACVFRAHKPHQLRLGEEVCPPEGLPIGAHIFNAIMERELWAKVRGKIGLEDPENNVTREGVVQSILYEFEHNRKNKMDLEKRVLSFYRHGAGRLEFNVAKQKELFQPIIEEICNFVKRMTITVRQKTSRDVDKWVLTGGFSTFRPLRRALEKALRELDPPFRSQNILKSDISNFGCDDVVVGLVLRASSKDHGPHRYLRFSLGVTRHHLTGDMNDRRALPGRPRMNRLDGNLRVVDAIDWKIQKGTLCTDVGGSKIYTWESEFHFGMDRTQWDAYEEFWVSDKEQEESELYFGHPKNVGAEMLHKVRFNLNELSSFVRPVYPREDDYGKPHFQVVLLVSVKVVDRNLEISAQWPATEEDKKKFKGVKRMFKAILPMAAGFQAGTA